MEEEQIRLNWPAIICVVMSLVIIGWMMGQLVQAPDGKTIECSSTSDIQAVQVGDHVEVFC